MRPDDNVAWLVERHALAGPDAPALLPADGGAPISWRGLRERAGAAAHRLERLGVRPGDRVLVFLPMGAPLYIAMLAVFRRGATVVFLDSWARRGELGFAAGLVEPVAVVADERGHSAMPALPSRPRRIVPAELAPGSDAVPVAPVDPDHTALVTFTTGSSGRPKGADRTHGFLAAQHRALAPCLPYDAQDVDLTTFPIFCLNNLASRVTTALPALDLAAPAAGDGLALAAQMRAHRVTTATLSPSLLRKLTRTCAESGLTLPAMRRVVTGGAPVGAPDVRALARVAAAAELVVLYGSTEVEPVAHIRGADLAGPGSGAGVCVGRIVPALEARFVEIERGPIELGARTLADREVPPGVPGELIVSGPHVCRASYRDEDATRRGKIREPGGRVWHRTGDVGYVDQDGRLRLVGRVHNVILRAGRPLYPVDAELALASLPGVRQAAYVGLADAALGEAAVAAVSLEDGADRGRVEAAVRRDLEARGLPVDRVAVLAAIPMDPRHHSKVEYAALRELLEAVS